MAKYKIIIAGEEEDEIYDTYEMLSHMQIILSPATIQAVKQWK